MAESADDPSLYWVEPEIRGIIPLDGLNVSSSLRKVVKQRRFQVKVNTAFAQVMRLCAERTEDREDTWINSRILSLYGKLHEMGHGHSVECWQGERLVGGLYGIHIGAAFFGESMFSRETDASKVALVHLVARLNFGGFTLLDAQFTNPHLVRLGAVEIKKVDYLKKLAAATAGSASFHQFQGDDDVARVLELAQGKARQA